MSSTDVYTNGNGVFSDYAMLHYHNLLDKQIASFHLKIGNDQVIIKFDSWQEMISFCEQHNFSYSDDRTGVEKYLARMEQSS